MAVSGNEVTRFGLYGGSRSPYGSFSGKTAQSIVTVPGIEYAVDINRLHYRTDENRLHYRVKEED